MTNLLFLEFYKKGRLRNLCYYIKSVDNNVLNLDRNLWCYPADKNLSFVPGVLIECGFLSNPKEKNLLNSSSYQQKIATTIKDALINYY